MGRHSGARRVWLPRARTSVPHTVVLTLLIISAVGALARGGAYSERTSVAGFCWDYSESPEPSDSESPEPSDSESPEPSDSESPEPCESEEPSGTWSPDPEESEDPSGTWSPDPEESEDPSGTWSPDPEESEDPSGTWSPDPEESEDPPPSYVPGSSGVDRWDRFFLKARRWSDRKGRWVPLRSWRRASRQMLLFGARSAHRPAAQQAIRLTDPKLLSQSSRSTPMFRWTIAIAPLLVLLLLWVIRRRSGDHI